MNFEYHSYPGHVYFGNNAINQLPGLLEAYARIMVIATPRLTEKVEGLMQSLGKDRVAWFSNVTQHVPGSLVREAAECREAQNPGILVAMGGGSAIGLSKALALEKYIPQVAIPTTFAGSEQTNIYGISSGGVKKNRS